LALGGTPPAEEGAPLVVRLMPPAAGAPVGALAAALPVGGGMPVLSDHAAMADMSMPAVEQRLGEAREEGMSIMGALSPLPGGPSEGSATAGKAPPRRVSGTKGKAHSHTRTQARAPRGSAATTSRTLVGRHGG
jgi:hypothetical protein